MFYNPVSGRSIIVSAKKGKIKPRGCTEKRGFDKAKCQYNGSVDKVRKIDGITVFLLLIGGIVAGVSSFFTMRPELFWVCTLILMFSIVTIITDNKYLNSIVMGAFVLYLGLVPVTFLFPAPTAFIVHITNLILVSVVTFKHWKNSVPVLIILSSVFFAVYIQAYIIAVKTEYGSYDPFHYLYNFWVAAFIVLGGMLVALVVKVKLGKWF